MNIQHLRYAVEVERTGSITEAAENLYITQPSLSKAIRELESGVGITIFERTPRGVIPTRKGRALLEHARAILQRVDEIESLAAGDDPTRQAFSIAMPRASYIAEGAARFAAALDFKRPMQVRIEETGAAEAVSGVAEGRFRMGIARFPVAEEAYYADLFRKRSLKSETVWEFDSAVLASSRSPLAARPVIEEAQLNGLIEITYAARENRARTQAITVYSRASQFELLEALPNAYMWVSPLPVNALARYHLSLLRCPDGAQRYRDVLIYTADYRFTDCDRLFIDRLFEVKNEVAFSDAR